MTGCFTWQWDTPHSDHSLHLPRSKELTALLSWLDQDPHLMSPGKLANRETLLQICLGLGLLSRDATLIQFTEDGGHLDETPTYITQSVWGTREIDKFGDYLKRLWTAIAR